MIKVMYYSGMNDLIVPTPATAAFLQKLQWKGASGFKSTNRVLWTHKLPNQQVYLNGYAKQFNNTLSFVQFRNASHAVPFDRPAAAFDMVHRFIENIAFD